MIEFSATKQEHFLIDQISERYRKHVHREPLYLAMDIHGCHCNGCPLDLSGLLFASEEDFLHDMAGIEQNIDRTTGKLRNQFIPRYARSEQRIEEIADSYINGNLSWVKAQCKNARTTTAVADWFREYAPSELSGFLKLIRR